MDIEKLLALFPKANFGEKQAGAISFRQGDAFLNIPAAELSEKERKILEIFLGKTDDFEVECGVWQDYLTKKSNVKPIKRGKIRFIQYEIHSLNQAEFDMEMFKKAFSALFPKEPEAVFFLSKNSGVAVEKINAASFDKEEFKGKNLDAIFGGIDLDLRGAKITSDVVINASAVFGGIDIIVPENVKVKIKSNAIFGGVSARICPLFRAVMNVGWKVEYLPYFHLFIQRNILLF